MLIMKHETFGEHDQLRFWFKVQAKTIFFRKKGLGEGLLADSQGKKVCTPEGEIKINESVTAV